MTVTGFIVQHGRILVEESFSPGALDPALLDAARTVFEALQAGQDTVPLPQCLGENGVVGLGNPVLPLEYVPEAERENWLATQNAVAQEQRRTGFYIAISGRIEFYKLVPEGSTTTGKGWAGLYGSIAGTFAHVEVRSPPAHRDPRPLAAQIQQHQEVATKITTAAPAFMRTGWLTGQASAFGDCFALVMLSAPTESSN